MRQIKGVLAGGKWGFVGEGGFIWGARYPGYWVAKLRYHTRHYIWKGGWEWIFILSNMKKARFFKNNIIFRNSLRLK